MIRSQVVQALHVATACKIRGKVGLAAEWCGGER